MCCMYRRRLELLRRISTALFVALNTEGQKCVPTALIAM